MHLQVKLKKLQLEEERLATVERDNRVLLEKMTHIMRTSGRVDNHNDYEHKRWVIGMNALSRRICARVSDSSPLAACLLL